MSLWLAKDYLKKALNRWDIDGKKWVNEAIIAIRKEEDRIQGLEAEAETLNQPHLEPTDCPTYYDGCHCTVETLVYNIKRAEKADERIKELEAGQLDFAKETTRIHKAKIQRIKELEAENKELQEILHNGNIDKSMVSAIGRAMEEKRKAEQKP